MLNIHQSVLWILHCLGMLNIYQSFLWILNCLGMLNIYLSLFFIYQYVCDNFARVRVHLTRAHAQIQLFYITLSKILYTIYLGV